MRPIVPETKDCEERRRFFPEIRRVKGSKMLSSRLPDYFKNGNLFSICPLKNKESLFCGSNETTSQLAIEKVGYLHNV